MRGNLKSFKSDYITQAMGSELLLYNLKTNKVFHLNETCATVWHECGDAKSVSQISENIARKTKSPIAEDIVQLTLLEFRKQGLVDNDAFIPTRQNGVTRRTMLQKTMFSSLVVAPLISSIVAPLAVQAQSIVTSNAACGNGVTEPFAGEQCDDGNPINGDGCSNSCQLEPDPVCGNAVTEPRGGEQCDDGNNINGDGCSNSCQLEPDPVCGNAVTEPRAGEQCDDGNLINGDGCETNCQFTPDPVCGNGVTEPRGGEQCDDGNLINGDGCENNCLFTR